uniref:transcription factor protein isoform X1 n=1 Tax=Ciona intestinalis TaxID=7719 RepID=UPI00089DBD36|nr:transcription factor protein isoform X1 [Ciona intestinalis]XP_018666950.1 transcription factor protein isoform X1 [Ciona intestinalis]|eukprot:XP_018666949.1 transcription factor protein isoform X1 [Ciona intestinalis]
MKPLRIRDTQKEFCHVPTRGRWRGRRGSRGRPSYGTTRAHSWKTVKFSFETDPSCRHPPTTSAQIQTSNPLPEKSPELQIYPEVLDLRQTTEKNDSWQDFISNMPDTNLSEGEICENVSVQNRDEMFAPNTRQHCSTRPLKQRRSDNEVQINNVNWRAGTSAEASCINLSLQNAEAFEVMQQQEDEGLFDANVDCCFNEDIFSSQDDPAMNRTSQRKKCAWSEDHGVLRSNKVTRQCEDEMIPMLANELAETLKNELCAAFNRIAEDFSIRVSRALLEFRNSPPQEVEHEAWSGREKLRKTYNETAKTTRSYTNFNNQHERSTNVVQTEAISLVMHDKVSRNEKVKSTEDGIEKMIRFQLLSSENSEAKRKICSCNEKNTEMLLCDDAHPRVNSVSKYPNQPIYNEYRLANATSPAITSPTLKCPPQPTQVTILTSTPAVNEPTSIYRKDGLKHGPQDETGGSRSNIDPNGMYEDAQNAVISSSSDDKPNSFQFGTAPQHYPIGMGLTSQHLKKSKLMFFYTRYPCVTTLKSYFSDVQFSRATTSQLIKWFSNFREFYYMQMERFARQALVDGITEAEQILVGRNSEVFHILNIHYNKSNDFEAPQHFLDVVTKTIRNFFTNIKYGKDNEAGWKKVIYKVICKLDQDIPEIFKSPNVLNCLGHTKTYTA